MPSPQLRVFVLDNDDVARAQFVTDLAAEPTISIAGDASATFDNLPKLADLDVDVVVLTLQFPGASGVELCRVIRERHPEIACLVLTTSDETDILVEAIVAGAAGYVLEREPVSVVARTLAAIAAGHAVVDPSITQRVLDRMVKKDPLDALTNQERRVFALVAEGHTNRQIADELSLALQTVKNYVRNILSKLGLQRRVQIATLAVRKSGGGRFDRFGT